ncbi:MAG: hypothetical protein ACR2P3_10090 [Geminicoccaceae bacterium]
MTRRELAEFLRQHANTLHLPLVDGTILTRAESEMISVAMMKLSAAASSIEVSNACDANALRGVGIEADAD